MTYKETEILIQKYLNGETTAEEEKLLALEVSREDAPEDWKVIAEMLGELTVDEALFDQIMAERKPKPRLMRFWPWVAAACVAALLVVFLGPPREDTVSKPQIAKVEPKPKVAEEPKTIEPQETVNSNTSTLSLPKHKTRHKPRVSRRAEEEQQESITRQKAEPVAKPESITNDIAQTEEPIMQEVIYDANMDFKAFTRSIRERGERVTQRIAMSSQPRYQLN
jgi:hypothetical protein